MRLPRWIPIIIAAMAYLGFSLPARQAIAEEIIADHYSVGEFGFIPSAVIEGIGDDYHIYYVHTSHGSQIVTGIGQVYAEDNLYDPPYFYEHGDDLGHNGDTSWVPNTRSYLDSHPACNMAMFSWCGGCSDNTEAGINIYLAKIEELAADYPAVIFIYMTGHLDGGGPTGNLYTRNNQIRDYCTAHDKILFDFADIESYDPDGTWYPEETDYCNWCLDWCNSHPGEFGCGSCGGCAHSQCFNCYLKGKAWWWMMAWISGWRPGGCDCTAHCDLNLDNAINPVDVVYIVNFVYKGIDLRQQIPSCPADNGDWDCDGNVNPVDVVEYVNFVYKGLGAGPYNPCAGLKP